jgi:membrane protease YdiL (CAAX protease family)
MEVLLHFLSSNSRGNSLDISFGRAFVYSSIVSTSFVGSLFVLVPRRIRALDRNDVRQIKWRAAATMVASLGALALYPFMIGVSSYGGVDGERSIRMRRSGNDDERSRVRTLSTSINLVIRATATACAQVIAHVALLYLGPLVKSVLQVQEYLKHRDDSLMHMTFWKVYYRLYLQPTVRSLLRPYSASERWVILRSLVLAPLVEEIVFRGCIVSALSATHMKEAHAVVLAPLFFGTAHIHHAVTKLSQGESLVNVLGETAAQFTYTSLFGMYASLAYLRTRSILAIAAGHAFCNAMSLPDLTFRRQGSLLYARRQELLGAHVAGFVGFALGMNLFLPKRS